MSSDKNVTVASENATQETTAAKSGQKDSEVVIENCVAPTPETAKAAAPANAGSVRVLGDVECQRSTGGVDSRQEKEEEFAEVVPGLGRPVVLPAPDVTAVAAAA